MDKYYVINVLFIYLLMVELLMNLFIYFIFFNIVFMDLNLFLMEWRIKVE